MRIMGTTEGTFCKAYGIIVTSRWMKNKLGTPLTTPLGTLLGAPWGRKPLNPKNYSSP
jgi:hypothetical protein